MHGVYDSRFQTRKAEIKLAVRYLRLRQFVSVRVAQLRRRVDEFSAGILVTQRARRFVKTLARRVVARSADNVVLRVVAHFDDVAVPARDDQAEVGRLKVGVGDVIRRDVPRDVVHGYQRYAARHRQPFRETYADQQRADKPRRVCHGYTVDVGEGAVCLQKRLAYHPADVFRVAARSDLGHYTAVKPVLVDLARNYV